MKILLGYSYYNYPRDVKVWVENWINRLRKNGFDIIPYPLTLNPPGPCLSWNELDYYWKTGNKDLFKKYEELGNKLIDFDVFLNWNGINIHPKFIEKLPTFNVFSCFDDPESSERLSRPVAASYDLSLVGNIAEIETYRSWGVENVEFWPLGFWETEYDPNLTYEKILNQERKYPVSLICERISKYREDRLDKFYKAFPQGKYYGKGWPNGFLDDCQKINLYQNTRIGINIHNSTGPINYRTYELPANGVMQICDNKHFLSKLFRLNHEVVGFDTIDEAIELTRYYINNDDERKRIAANGWKKSISDYNETTIFKMAIDYIYKYSNANNSLRTSKKSIPTIFFRRKRIMHKSIYFFLRFLRRIKKLMLTTF